MWRIFEYGRQGDGGLGRRSKCRGRGRWLRMMLNDAATAAFADIVRNGGEVKAPWFSFFSRR